MGKVWIHLLSRAAVEKCGEVLQYQAGDWVEVGGHQARLLVSRGIGEIVNPLAQLAAFDLLGCGVVITGDGQGIKSAIEQAYPALDVSFAGTPELFYARTLLCHGNVRINTQYIPIGFHRINSGWRAAIPLVDHDTLLAEHLGTEEDRIYTKSIVRDLRVFAYNPNMMFLLRCPENQRLLDVWKEEQGKGTDSYLAFLRAIYLIKPVVCALPSNWTS